MTDLLTNYSAEVMPGDRKSIEAAIDGMQRGSEVFIPSLRSDTGDQLVVAAAHLSRAGLRPVPHIVARNIENLAGLDRLLGRLRSEADVERVLLLAGDREKALGELHSSLQLLESGVLERHGIRHIGLAAHPEGHPRVSAAEIAAARIAKVSAADRRGMHVTFVTQFCFDAAPILALAEEIRAEGITAPIYVGVAGPASRAALVKYALICGVGASLRALKDRHAAARNMFSGETPEHLLREVAGGQARDPALGLAGVHFFTFGSLAATIAWVEEQRMAPGLR